MPIAKPGAALKQLRKTNGWTLADVSKRTGIPPSTLSRIENDRVSPTYDLLARLSQGLSVDMAQLVSSAEAPAAALAEQQGRRSLNRLGDGELIEMSNHTLRYLSTDLLRKQVTPILCEYRARTLEEFGDFMRHAGEEFLFVLEGAVELHTEYNAPVVLKAGESIYFDSRMGHAYLAHGPGVCRALSINVTPHEEMRKVHDVAAARARPSNQPAKPKRATSTPKPRRRRTG
jgi:transcriptional regulator with XRE-family HTH domain